MKKKARQEVTIFGQQLQISNTGDYRGAQNVNFVSKFVQNGVFIDFKSCIFK